MTQPDRVLVERSASGRVIDRLFCCDRGLNISDSLTEDRELKVPIFANGGLSSPWRPIECRWTTRKALPIRAKLPKLPNPDRCPLRACQPHDTPQAREKVQQGQQLRCLIAALACAAISLAEKKVGGAEAGTTTIATRCTLHCRSLPYRFSTWMVLSQCSGDDFWQFRSNIWQPQHWMNAAPDFHNHTGKQDHVTNHNNQKQP
ncbi:protein of unknown function [Bradyrhizobium vignae]|uniref:Uncharacterized protein n=1 Tax=Bradyrhizobium vignae TaxID=1549949 RepID=A0A2U3PUS8_9BRAD|nr:protein of unknown function [Bradyrhizobium vignae]